MEAIYRELRDRKLCRTRGEYALMWLGAGSRSYAVPNYKPSVKALVRLHRNLSDAKQHDLACLVMTEIFGDSHI